MTAPGCERCAQLEQLLTTSEANLAELGAQLGGMQHQLRRAGAAENALRNQLNQVREDDPDADTIRELLHLWRDECKAGDKRVKVDSITGPRGQRVKWGLRKYGKERIHNAVMGATLDKWAMGRDPRTSGREFNDIAKHILKDEETIERFEKAWADRDKPKAAPAPTVRQTRAQHPDPGPRILGKLEGVREVEPGKWNARCPAHEDRNASLSVAHGHKGIVMNCHAGCSVEKIADAIGVPLAEWFDPNDHAPVVRVAERAPAALPTEKAISEWAEALQRHPGLLARLLEVRGWAPTTLKALQLGWDGSRIIFPVRDGQGQLLTIQRYLPGGKPKMLAPARRPRGLFPAPETITGDTIWLVEGEPDAVSAHQLGLPGVAIPGASTWDAAWSPRFTGRRVVICMDCDQAGRDAADKLLRHLAPAALELRVVDLGPARDDKYDLTDYLLEGGGAAGLHALAAKSAAVHQLGNAA